MMTVSLDNFIPVVAKALRAKEPDVDWLTIKIDVGTSNERVSIQYRVILSVEGSDIQLVDGPDVWAAFNEAVRRARWERDAKMKALPEPEAA